MSKTAKELAALDHRCIWHPFTQMREWLAEEPVTIVSGKGTVLRDAQGRTYLDANSSIWTNLHGHAHPFMNRAIWKQLRKIAHSSALGLANEPASILAEKLVLETAGTLHKVFYSDDGSTAIEVALKLSYEYWRRAGEPRPKFLSLEGAYHGDTVGAVSAGHIDLFHKAYGGLLFRTESVMAPYCYRCPFNRAQPERADARSYRKCNWECTGEVEKKFAAGARAGERITGFVVEPLMQGAAGMIPQPEGWLKRVAEIVRSYKAHLIADEVMTAFGRVASAGNASSVFATISEGVAPDFIAAAKGLTGGYLPMAATLTTNAVFGAFLGEYDQFKTFFHGHSYTGNQLGSAAALASYELLTSAESRAKRVMLEGVMKAELEKLWPLRRTGDIRQAGLVAGLELVRDWRTREPFDLRERAGIRVCRAMAKRGVLTRPIGNVVVIMPPYCTTARQMKKMIAALAESIEELK